MFVTCLDTKYGILEILTFTEAKMGRSVSECMSRVQPLHSNALQGNKLRKNQYWISVISWSQEALHKENWHGSVVEITTWVLLLPVPCEEETMYCLNMTQKCQGILKKIKITDAAYSNKWLVIVAQFKNQQVWYLKDSEVPMAWVLLQIYDNTINLGPCWQVFEYSIQLPWQCLIQGALSGGIVTLNISTMHNIYYYMYYNSLARGKESEC